MTAPMTAAFRRCLKASARLRRAPRIGAATGAFIKDQRGATLVELAFVIPIMLTVAVGAIDTTRLILLHQKLDKAAATVVDLTTRPSSISASDVDLIFTAAQDVLVPFDLSTGGRVIVTSVTQPAGGTAAIDWQRAGGGTYGATSSVGAVGAAPTLPTGFVVADGENLIVAEVFFDFDPIFLDYVLGSDVLSHMSIRKPRNGALSTLN